MAAERVKQLRGGLGHAGGERLSLYTGYGAGKPAYERVRRRRGGMPAFGSKGELEIYGAFFSDANKCARPGDAREHIFHNGATLVHNERRMNAARF